MSSARFRVAALLIFIFLVGLMAPRNAAAQLPEPLHVGLGYQWRHLSFDGHGEAFPIGFYGDVGRVFKADDKKAWGWVGQVEGGFHSGDGVSERLFTFLGGVSVASRKMSTWTPSARGLIGFGILDNSCDTFCGGSEHALAIQGDVALTRRLNNKVSAQVIFKAGKAKVSGHPFEMTAAGGVRVDLGQEIHIGN